MMIVICLYWLFIILASSAIQANENLQAISNLQPVRRELDLNTTPTASMEEVPFKQQKEGEDQSKVKKKRVKFSEKERKKRKYENNRDSIQRYRFKYSKKGQELAAKNLNPIEKAEYDKKLESFRLNNKTYKQTYYDKLQLGVEHNDPRAIEQDFKNKISNRIASRKYMRKIRAQQKEVGLLDNQNKHE